MNVYEHSLDFDSGLKKQCPLSSRRIRQYHYLAQISPVRVTTEIQHSKGIDDTIGQDDACGICLVFHLYSVSCPGACEVVCSGVCLPSK